MIETTETSRTYHYLTAGKSLQIDKVRRIEVLPDGTHRIETEDGHKVVIRPTWDSVQVVDGDWTA